MAEVVECDSGGGGGGNNHHNKQNTYTKYTVCTCYIYFNQINCAILHPFLLIKMGFTI